MVTAESFATLTVYLGVMVVSFLLAILYRNSIVKKELTSIVSDWIVRGLVALPVSLLFGLRSLEVGWDTASLVNVLFSSRYNLSSLLASQHDPVFTFLSKSLFFIAPNNTFLYLFLLAFLTQFIFLSAVRRWENGRYLHTSYLTYLLYFALIGMDQSRQMLAISIMLYGTVQLIEGKRKAFLIYVTIAGLFHFTAFFAYIFLIFKMKDKRHRVLKTLAIASVVFVTVFPEILFSQLGRFFGNTAYFEYFTGRYARLDGEEGGTGLRFVLDIIPCMAPLFFFRSLPKDSRWLIIISLLSTMPLRMLGYQSDFLYRIYYEPAIAIVFAYPYAFSYLSNKGRFFRCFMLILILLVYFYISYSTSHGIIPYESPYLVF